MLTKGTVTSIKEEGAGMVVCASNTLLGENIEIEAELVVVPTGMVPTTAHDPTINLVYRTGSRIPRPPAVRTVMQTPTTSASPTKHAVPVFTPQVVFVSPCPWDWLVKMQPVLS